jgi:hypothetical protein
MARYSGGFQRMARVTSVFVAKQSTEAGSNRYSMASLSAASSRRENLLELSISAFCGFPSAPTKIRTTLVPLSSNRKDA